MVDTTSLKSNILLLAILVVQVVGFGFLLNRNSESETIFVPTSTSDASAANGGQSIPITAIRLPDSESLRASVRSVLQDELRAYVRQASGVPSQRETETARIAQDPRGNAEAFSRSNTVVDQAVSRRTWTLEDSAALMPNIAKLSAEQRLEVTKKFHAALNRQELKLMGPPPL